MGNQAITPSKIDGSGACVNSNSEERRSKGYVKLRRGLLDHFETGKMSPPEAGVYFVILLKADHRTGIWQSTSAKTIAWYYRRHMTERRVRKALQNLEEAGYIKRFRTIGSHLSYPILVNKYPCRDDAGNEFLLNAEKTRDAEHPVYEPCCNSTVTAP
jgi:hypothetical protein